MNNLSWFLYLAEVLNSLGVAAIFMGFLISSFGTLGAVFVYQDTSGRTKWPLYLTLTLGPLLIFFSTLLPSKSTMYAIAASELGEQAMESRMGNKAMQAIEAWIDSQLPKPNK